MSCKNIVIIFSMVIVWPMTFNHASAAIIKVDWNATVSPQSTTTPSPGAGFLSGSLGAFDVSAVGEIFSIPSDSSLSISASGFSGGFPNGSYALTRITSQPFQLEFASVGTNALDFAVNIIDNNAGILSPFRNPCLVGGVSSNCFVALFDTAGTGEDTALASLGLNGSLDDTSLGIINYSFTVVPVPAAVWLFGSGLFGLFRMRKISSKIATLSA